MAPAHAICPNTLLKTWPTGFLIEGESLCAYYSYKGGAMTNLKILRGKARMTQSGVAAEVGVSQPTYQRWESGIASVPQNKRAKLAQALGTDVDTILGRRPPVEAVIYSHEYDDEAGYWGEAAFHFRGQGEPLLLTLSDHAYTRLYRDLQGTDAFLVVRSMANQTVVIRRGAIKDVYLSSEAHDDLGVEGKEYAGFHHIMVPDHGEWAIIASLAIGVGEEEYKDEDLDRVRGLIGDGDRAEAYFALATKVVWQFADGERRREEVLYADEFYVDAKRLVEFDDECDDTSLLMLRVVDGHRIIFLNFEGIDYLTLPTHAYEDAVALAAADDMDAMEP